jgi:hypothetical protein
MFVVAVNNPHSGTKLKLDRKIILLFFFFFEHNQHASKTDTFNLSYETEYVS